MAHRGGAERSVGDAYLQVRPGRDVRARRHHLRVRPDDRISSLKCFQRRQHLQPSAGRLERRPLPLDRKRRRLPQAFVRTFDTQALPLDGDTRGGSKPLRGALQSLPVPFERAPDAPRERAA